MYKDDISIIDMLRKIELEINAVIIDVRTSGEWDATGTPYIAGVETHKITVVSVPDMELKNDFLPIFLEKVSNDQVVYCICRGGKRSKLSAGLVAQNGYGNVYNVNGGMIEWMEMGYPVKS